MVVPALALAVTMYFGTYAIWGGRGLIAFEDVQAKLAVDKQRLAEVTAEHERLQHRIDLLAPGHADPDLIEELARGQLIEGGPNQVAVPRDAH
jgi:cell division protein FtsB